MVDEYFQINSTIASQFLVTIGLLQDCSVPQECQTPPPQIFHMFFLRSSTCVTRTVGGSRTCAATTPASTRSSGSATGTTTSTVPTLLIGQFPTSVLDLHIFFHMALLQVLLERPDLQNRPAPSREGEKGPKPGRERRRRLLRRRGQHQEVKPEKFVLLAKFRA